MNVLVTGANGFIGSALTRRLALAGDSVRILVRPGANLALLQGLRLTKPDGSEMAPGMASGMDGRQESASVSVFEGDLHSSKALESASKGVDVVVHLAGLRRSPTREELFRVNAEGTRNLCQSLAQVAPGARFVLCSSLTAVGPSCDFPDEDAPLNPQDWYGESKAEAESIVRGFRESLEVAIARPTRVTGPGDRENLAFFKVVQRGYILSIDGARRPMSTIDVDDLTSGFEILARRRGGNCETFFLSRDVTTMDELMTTIAGEMGIPCPHRIHVSPRTIRALASAADVVTRLTGRRLPLNRKLAQQMLAPGWTCSVDKARRVLGFTPSVPLETSLKTSLKWYREKGWLKG